MLTLPFNHTNRCFVSDPVRLFYDILTHSIFLNETLVTSESLFH